MLKNTNSKLRGNHSTVWPKEDYTLYQFSNWTVSVLNEYTFKSAVYSDSN